VSISKARILDNAIAAITAANRYIDADGGPLEGVELANAQQATRTGLEFLVDAIIDELTTNAIVSTTVATTTTGTAATNALPVNGVPEVVGDAAVTGTGAGAGIGGLS